MLNGTQYLQVQAGEAAFANCHKLIDSQFYTQANDHISSIWSFGNIDIHTLISKGQTLTFRWLSADAKADLLYFWIPQIQLRIYQILSGTA